MASFWYLAVMAVVLIRQIKTAGAIGHWKPLKSMYQFGDSLADTGNLLRLLPYVNACSTFPYGETYFGHPSGRCSDGLLMTDFFAKAFGLPFLKPYMDTTADFKHGVNFAILGATALDEAFFQSKNISVPLNDSLSIELDWFKTHLNSISTSSNNHRTILRRSLIFMGEIGGNDINYPLIQGKSVQSVYDLIPNIIEAIKNATQIVIDEGAVHIVVPGNFPIGCLPLYVTNFASNDTSNYDDNKCIKSLNQLVQFQNIKIKEAIRELQEHNPRVIIIYADYYNAYLNLIDNAASLGFDKDQVFNACCGTSVNGCGNEGAPVCKNPKKFISWDGLHPSHQANKHMVKWILPRIFFAEVRGSFM